MTKRNVILYGLGMAASAAVLLAVFQRLVQPKYMTPPSLDGNLIGDYYNSGYDHDVLFIGDCECYENFSPVTIWQDYGIPCYIRGSAQQLIWQSYYLLEDALRYEKPKVAVFNVLSMKYGEPQKEEYNRMSIEGMRWSMSKVNNIKASMTEEESFLSYVFPVLRYHSGWSSISAEDFRYFFGVKPNFFAGYYLRADVKAAANVPKGTPLTDYKFSDTCWDYLDRMRTLCEENDIQLVLIKAPSLYPYWYPEWNDQITDYAAAYDLPYINFLDEEVLAATGIDYHTDTYDAGLHLNVFGAEKISHWFGGYLRENFALPDRIGEPALAKEYAEIAERYHAEIERQQQNLSEYGNVFGLTAQETQ